MSAPIDTSTPRPGEVVRLAELLAAVSLATDLADYAPFESALTSLQLARLAGLSGEDLTDVYYFALLYHLGCTASADRHAQVAAGDDVSSRRWFSEQGAAVDDHDDAPASLRGVAEAV